MPRGHGSRLRLPPGADCAAAGEGTAIGPDLTGMAVHPKEELLIHIIDPSRSVEGNFKLFRVLTTDDRTIIGMIVQQALALGLIGFAIGATLIVNIKDYFPRRVVLEPDNVLILAAIVFVVCLISSALGVRAALKVDPATALGG